MPIDENLEDMELQTFSVDEELALGQEEWKDAKMEDKEYGELKKFMSNSEQDTDTLHGSLQQYLEVKDELSAQGEKVLRRDRSVPPMKLRRRLIKMCMKDT
ncbi:hypothetical protein NDU88_002934 [Pleurodeles waltl]|uniref:Uncharacterized protein n=1 Tax=Pleurodeles waltl TaxID=8319 RepID=A0AAV7REX2_PLEWA|nr:hypothetical protein NDU88_002934 [Pleurodeles waltl]